VAVERTEAPRKHIPDQVLMWHMPFNLSGTLAVFHALVRPRLIIPNLVVEGMPSMLS